jgi:heme/copper-type cytochrome/quinol oxidase subunit 2
MKSGLSASIVRVPLIVQQGDEVELTLVNKLDEPHGFKIEDFGIEEVVQPKAQTTVKFTAATPGVHGFVCHIHPPHIGANPAMTSVTLVYT